MYKNTTASRLQHQFNAGSINVRTATCDAKCEEVIAREADHANLTICGLQETRRLKKGEVILNIPGKKSQYIFHWSGFERKREYGVGLLIRKSPFIQVENVNSHGPRHISASIVIKGCKVFVISAYAPTETATASAKSAFYCELNKIIKSRPQNSQLITVGDFNATAQAASSYTRFRGSTYVTGDDLKSNENGEKLLDFCRKHDLSILNSWFDQKIPSRTNTWYSNDGKTRKCIDFIISNSQMKSWCINCRVKSSFDFDSDH